MFSLGAVLGNMVCMIFNVCLHRKQRPFRLTLIFIMLSFLIASVAVALIFVPNIERFFTFRRNDYIYYAVLFAVGALCVSFPKVAFPIAAGVYVAVCIVSLVIVVKTFGLPEDTIPVSVSSTNVAVDKESYGVAVQPGQPVSVFFSVYTLPDKLLVPLPRAWYIPCGVSAVSAPVLPTRQMKESKFFFAYEYLLSKPSVSSVQLPASSVYPALYTLTTSQGLSSVSFTVKRTF